MRIAVIFDKTYPHTTGIYFERALRALGHDLTHCSVVESRALTGPFDLYVRIDDSNYTDEVSDHLRPRIYWVSDTHLPKPLKALRRLARPYDLAFVAMRDGTDILQRSGVNAVWVFGGACDPEIHRRLNVPRRYDVGFIGTDGGIPRKFYLQALRERYPNSFIGTAPHTQMSEIYSQSKIGFSYVAPAETLTMRSFEIMSCGAMLLLNAVRDEATHLLGFQPGRHLVLYRSPAEVFTLVDYYLARDAEREAIARAGHELTVQRHRYIDRAAFMLATTVKRLSGDYPHLAGALGPQGARATDAGPAPVGAA